MKSAYDCALDLQRELEDDGGVQCSEFPHVRDADISPEGLVIIERHIERIISEAREDERKKAVA